MLAAPHMKQTFSPVDDHLYNLPGHGGIPCSRYLLLQLHYAGHPPLLRPFGDCVLIIQRSVSVLLMRVTECTEPVKPVLTDEFKQLPVLFLRFAGMTGNHGGAHRCVRQYPADISQQPLRSRTVMLAAHHLQNLVGNMLDRDINIPANLRILLHDLKYLHREACRVEIVQPDPFKAVKLSQPPDKLGKHLPAIQVSTIQSQVLSNKYQFLNTL